MINTLFIFLGLMICVLVFGAIISENQDLRGIYIFLLVILSILLGGLIEIINEKKNPSAMDVYNNKTELSVTTVNGVPTDTVVVFKKTTEHDTGK